jgi:hypothetical protein
LFFKPTDDRRDTVSDRTVSDRTVSDRTVSDRTVSDRTVSDRHDRRVHFCYRTIPHCEPIR